MSKGKGRCGNEWSKVEEWPPERGVDLHLLESKAASRALLELAKRFEYVHTYQKMTLSLFISYEFPFY